jgi:hypothetical protein
MDLMNNFRRSIKKCIQKSPLGEKHILRAARFLARNLYLYQTTKWMAEKREASHIIKRLAMDNFDQAVVVYDMKVSPPTYGDCFYVVMIARFLLALGKKVSFFIINSDFGENVLRSYDSEECNDLVNRLLEVPEVLLRGVGDCNVQILPWHEYDKIARNYDKQERVLIVFQKAIENREPIYYHCFNLVNLLVPSCNSSQVKRFLLSKEEMTAKVEIVYPKIPYITLGARHSTKWGFERNITDDEFIKIYGWLHSLYPDHAIMIVSDETGCAHFRALARENDLYCLFSKDFSKTFMGDCALVINSAYYFQLRGGGISLAATYSSLPHLIVAETIHETIQRKKSLAVWATEDQVWKTEINDVSENIFR